MENIREAELIKKYQWAGKIRFITFTLLLSFLITMKEFGGYCYLNTALLSLIVVEALLNQPYPFFIRRVNVYRFQFYQMAVDIVVVSWLLYYMGGIEAPLVSIAYYAVILWAGVVSGVSAVLFATVLSSLLFASVVTGEYFGFLPTVSYFESAVATGQMYSLILGNVAFLFAFGYFSAYSSRVIRYLQKKHYEEKIKSSHKLLTAGYLASGVAHDLMNNLVCIRGYLDLLRDRIKHEAEPIRRGDIAHKFDRAEALGRQGVELLEKLSRFCAKAKEEFGAVSIIKIIDDAFALTEPLLRGSGININKVYEPMLPLVFADKGQMQEVFVALLLNSIENSSKKRTITITVHYLKASQRIEVLFTDAAQTEKQDILRKLSDFFFVIDRSERGMRLGLSVVREIILRHKGEITVLPDVSGRGGTFIIQLPVAQEDGKKNDEACFD